MAVVIPDQQKLAQLNDAYSGTAQVILIQDAAVSAADSLATWLGHEVSDYQGSGRQTITWATATTLDGASAAVSFVPTTGPIACRYAIVADLVRSRLMHIYDFGAGYSIPTAGITLTYTPRFIS